MGPKDLIEGDNGHSVSPDAASQEAPAIQDENTAASSSGQDNSTDPTQAEAPTLESVVAAALTQDAPKPDAEAKAEGETPAGDTQPKTEGDKSTPEANAEGEGDELPDDPTDEELADLRAKPRKRIAKLLSQRNAARRELEALQPDAQNYRAIRTYMAETGLVNEDVANLFKFGAHLKTGNFEEAFKIAEPFFRVILEGTGRAIPQDLRGRVDSGEMTEDAARLVARERMARAAAEQRVQATETKVNEDRATAHVQAIQTATAEWEASVRATDLDFDLKAEAMKRFAVALVAEKGLPKNAQEAVAYAKQAYADATEFLRAARPAPKPSRPAPSPGTSSPRSAPSTSTATSLQDAIMAGLAAGARG